MMRPDVPSIIDALDGLGGEDASYSAYDGADDAIMVHFGRTVPSGAEKRLERHGLEVVARGRDYLAVAYAPEPGINAALDALLESEQAEREAEQLEDA